MAKKEDRIQIKSWQSMERWMETETNGLGEERICTYIRGSWTRLHPVHSVRLYSIRLKPYFPHIRPGGWRRGIIHPTRLSISFSLISKLVWESSYSVHAIRAPVQNTTKIVHLYVRPVISRRWSRSACFSSPSLTGFNELNERFRTALPLHVGRTPALLSPRRHHLSLRAANYGASSTWEQRRKHACRP